MDFDFIPPRDSPNSQSKSLDLLHPLRKDVPCVLVLVADRLIGSKFMRKFGLRILIVAFFIASITLLSPVSDAQWSLSMSCIFDAP